MAHLTRPAEISGASAGSFPETAAGNRAYRPTIPFSFTKRLKIVRGRLSRVTNWPDLCCFFFLPSLISPEIIRFNDVTTKLTSSSFLSFLLVHFN